MFKELQFITQSQIKMCLVTHPIQSSFQRPQEVRSRTNSPCSTFRFGNSTSANHPQL